MGQRIEGARTADKGTAIEPDNDRPLGLGRCLGNSDIEKEAALIIAGLGQAIARRLRTGAAIGLGVENLRPRRDRGWRFEPARTDGRGGKGDAAIFGDAALFKAPDRPLLGLNDRQGLSSLGLNTKTEHQQSGNHGCGTKQGHSLKRRGS